MARLLRQIKMFDSRRLTIHTPVKEGGVKDYGMSIYKNNS